MFWFLGLPFEHPEDFWLNVLAGVPFLLFDIVIITLLLPRTIEWLNARRWDLTRRRVLKHVLKAYQDHLRLPDFQSIVRHTEGKSPKEIFSFLHTQSEAFVRYTYTTARAMETEIQTALPILDPDRSMALLEFHYQWKTYMKGLESFGRAMEDYLSRDPNDPSYTVSSAGVLNTIWAHPEAALSIGMAYRRLETYLKTHKDMPVSEARLITDPVDRVLQAWGSLLDTPAATREDLSSGASERETEREAANRQALLAAPDVALYGVRWFGLFGPTWMALYRPKAQP